ncbi:MAG: hypothetical protein KF842_04020 [Caulobacter sp.]|nr:hypothetical protein [Caulobacter sp.]
MRVMTLAAGAALLLGMTAIGASAQPSGAFDPVPEGSYQRSCRDITAQYGRLSARCMDRRGNLMASSLEIRRCPRNRAENDNGQLRCEGAGGPGGGGYPGGGGGGGGGRPGLIVYENPNYRGRSLEIRDTMPSLVGTGLDDQITAIQVISGRWELCVGQNFTGQCRVFDRSDPNLNLVNFNDKVSSIRRLRR